MIRHETGTVAAAWSALSTSARRMLTRRSNNQFAAPGEAPKFLHSPYEEET